MSAAVLSHRSDIVWWLHRHVPDSNYDLDTALRSALIMGDIVMAEWLASHGAHWPEHADYTVRTVVARGRLDVLQWLVEQGRLDRIIALVSIAAQRGHLEIVRWIVEWTLPNHTAVEHGILVLAVATLSIHTAATHGHLQVAKYLRETASRSVCGGYTAHFTGQEIESLRGVIVEASPEAQRVSGRTMILAAKKGFLNVIQWLYAEYGDDLETESFNVGPERLPVDTIAMDTAASYGHLDVLKYFHELQTSGETRLQCTKNAMDRTAENGNLSVVQYLYENRREGCTTAAMDKAAACGHFEVVKWLHQHRTEGCTQAAMDEAALPKRIEVVQWLHENRAEGCSTRAMDNAAMTGHLDMVKWLHLNRSEGCTQNAMDEAAICMLSNGYMSIDRKVALSEP
ncbi:hypothetical protein PC121_g24131 [Phytophthora cactorum]|nr:hypothetical protein PC121_g24131 [Phytophthora cactorum]